MTEFCLVSNIEVGETAIPLQDPGILASCRRAVIELHDTTLHGRDVSEFDIVDAAVSTGFQVIDRHGPVVALAWS